MPTYSYKCECGARFSEIRKMDERETCACPGCGAEAKQVLTPIRFDILGMGHDPDFATFGDQWERLHRDQKAREERSMGEHGDYGKPPGA